MDESGSVFGREAYDWRQTLYLEARHLDETGSVPGMLVLFVNEELLALVLASIWRGASGVSREKLFMRLFNICLGLAEVKGLLAKNQHKTNIR